MEVIVLSSSALHEVEVTCQYFLSLERLKIIDVESKQN